MLSLTPDSFHLSAGASYDGANWMAKATDAGILSVEPGQRIPILAQFRAHPQYIHHTCFTHDDSHQRVCGNRHRESIGQSAYQTKRQHGGRSGRPKT